ncbi:MAG: hypothetical protein QOJ54_378 [Aliidongia sp.]|nr:hypothetical protein [Aliidongia sp.]
MKLASRLAAIVAILSISVGLTAAAAPISLSDQELLDYAAASFDKQEMMNKRVMLGSHHGVPVVVDFPCGDLCPAYTIRIIRYDLPLGQDCEASNGTWQKRSIPRGRGTTMTVYCLPKVLAETQP